MGAVAVALVAVTLLVRAPLVDLPLERDEGEYAYIAWRLSLGDVPYRDWVDQKPPGIFWVYRLALALPGDPIPWFRWTAAAFSAVAAVALLLLARRLVGLPAALAASLLLIWTSADATVQGPIANTELYMLAPIVLAHLLFLGLVDAPRVSLARSAAVGALVAVACAFKPVAGVNAPLLLAAFPLLDRVPQRARRTAAFAGGAAVGGAGVALAIAAWFHVHEALSALLDAVLWHNLAYSASLPLASRLEALRLHLPAILRSQGPVWVLAAAGLVLLWRGGARRLALYVGGWLGASALGASTSGYFFPHYFQQVLPPLALAAGVAVWRAVQLPLWGRTPIALRAGLLALATLGPITASLLPLWRLDPGAAMRRMYPQDAFEAMPVLARELAAVTGPDDPVFVFGAEPELLFYARRASASRYIFLFPLYGPYPHAAAEQARVADALAAQPPAAIVSMPNQLFFRPDAPQVLTDRLRALVDARYRLHATMDDRSRTRVRRVGEPDAQPADPTRVWAALFLRRDPP